MYTQEQIEAKAMEIGARNYHPIPPRFFLDGNSDFATPGINIRQELMRTAMGATIPMEYGMTDFIATSKVASGYTNALLLEMARHELGVGE